MDQKLVDRLEQELEKAIMDIVARLGLRKLPLLPSHRTIKSMAKAAVKVYGETVAEEAEESPQV